MLLDAILKLHDKIQNTKLGPHRAKQDPGAELAKVRSLPLLGPVRGDPLMSSQHPEQKAEQAADHLPATPDVPLLEQPVVRKGMFVRKGHRRHLRFGA